MPIRPRVNRIGLSLGGYYADTDVRLRAPATFKIFGRASLTLPSGHERRQGARDTNSGRRPSGAGIRLLLFRRSRDQTLQQSFDIGDSHFDLGAQVHGRFDLDLDLGSARLSLVVRRRPRRVRSRCWRGEPVVSKSVCQRTCPRTTTSSMSRNAATRTPSHHC